MIKNILGLALTSVVLTSCAAGSGVAGISGYSIMSNTSQGLTAQGEQRIVDRVRKEVYLDNNASEKAKVK